MRLLPPELRNLLSGPTLDASRRTLAEHASAGYQALVPRAFRRALRNAQASARAVALEALPLPLWEVLRLGSLDPFIPRAATTSYRTSGVHFLILASAAMTDAGGGQRSAQLAHGLLARTHRVTYVYRFRTRDRLRRRAFVHENLTHARFTDFSARRFSLERGLRERVVVLCEIPLPEYWASLRWLKARRAQTVYDCVDDWDGVLGGSWYSRRIEDRLLAEVDLVAASSRSLKDAVEGRCWRDVALLPNAVNTGLFARGRTWPRPADLPAGPVLLYVGSLSGEWFQWDWVTTLARARPEASVVLVGDYRGQCREPPPNLYFLGLKPQHEVPGYVAHADVCFIPFRLEREVRAFSPLTAYEHLAMGKPVVSSEIPEVAELPGVITAHDRDGFVEAVGRAQERKPSEEEVQRFVAENSWKARVRQLERLLGV